jgi:hypothetical protein
MVLIYQNLLNIHHLIKNMGLRRDYLKSKGWSKLNKATNFLLPMIGYTVDDFSSGYKNYLINCYITKELDGKLIVICDHVDDEDFNVFMYRNEVNPCYEGSTLDDDEKEVQITYQIPDRYREDYLKIVDSKYSQISKSYKDRLTSIYGRKTNPDDYKATMYDALYPTEFKRKQIAERLGYDVKGKDWLIIEEVLDKLELDRNVFQSIDDLKLEMQSI